MEFSNIEVLDVRGNVQLLKLDFHHTRGDTTVYAVTDKPLPVDMDTTRFTVTKLVGKALFDECALGNVPLPSLQGRSYEQMLSFLER